MPSSTNRKVHNPGSKRDPPTIDGTLLSGEWDDARRELFADGSELFLIYQESYLSLAIRANTKEMIVGNIFINRSDEIAILHASAALGTAIYKKGTDDWQQTRGFSWQCRDTGNSDAAQVERGSFLQQEHSLAANSSHGKSRRIGVSN